MTEIAWYDDRCRPQFPVSMAIERFAEGIDYSVTVSNGQPVYETGDDEVTVWSEWVQFPVGSLDSTTEDFQRAEREQKEIAEAWVKAILTGITKE